MDVKNIHWCLRLLYLYLFGPGYFSGQLEAIYTWTWNADPDGPAKVVYDVMVNHGGNDALNQQRAANGYTGAFHTEKPMAEVLADLKAAGVTAEPSDEVKALVQSA